MNKIISFVLIAVAVGCQQQSYPPLVELTDSLKDKELAPFYHGVASGDPLQDRVIIWTRVTPADSIPELTVEWEVSIDSEFKEITSGGSATTDPGRDYTVKVDVFGLEPGNQYFYRFSYDGKNSIVGRTKTLATNTDNIKLGVVSCSNYEWGFFNAYGKLSEEELDAVVHLGDYIYEYAPGGYGDTTLGRSPMPDKEIISLQDYRTRYAQYRLDPDLRDAHANHPFINIWDDHEITNNSYKDGAQNHQEDEGSYETRKAVARQVYYEWLPIREGDKHYRKFSFGELADLIMLDERLEGRTQQADSLGDPSLMDSSRTMLGKTQLDWFLDNLRTSSANWKVIGNQVIYSYLNWGHPTFSINLDSWDGYPIEQQQIADAIQGDSIKNVVFVTGDTHTAWAFEATNNPLENYDPETSAGAFAVEFGTTSINSANSNERFPNEAVLEHEKKIVNSEINPHLKFTNMRDHGYMVLELTPDRASVRFMFMETIREKSREVKEEVSYWVNSGEVRLRSN